jgi:putative tricarboxylic transport membrane protein
VSFSAFDLLVMTVVGLVAYYMRLNDYPLAPAILGLVLGDPMEQNLRRSLIMSNGSVMIFLTRPVTAVFLALALLTLAAPTLLAALQKEPPPSPQENG